jgi:uncharacterized protein
MAGRLAHPARAFLLALVLAAGSFAAPITRAAEPKFPPLSGRVVDEAGLLSPAAKERITSWLADFETQTKRQVVVVTVTTLQGLPIEDYGYRLGRFWGIGQKGLNTGALLIVAPAERAVRIEVGYGLEGELTDAISRVIIENDILPAFRQGEYERGIEAGTVAMLRALGWQGEASVPQAARKPAETGLPPWLFIVLIVVFFTFMRSGFFFLPMGGGMWRGGSRGGFGGGGGGFSGGGGSFGGGGASGRW